MKLAMKLTGMLLLVIVILPSLIAGNWTLKNYKFNQPAAIPTPVNQFMIQKPNQTKKLSAIRLGWFTGTISSNLDFSAYKGLNVLSPTFAQISTKNMQVIEHSSPEQIQKLHSEGIQVWPRIVLDEDTKTNTHAILSQASTRMDLVKKIYMDAKQGGWDGINLDIENVSANDRSLFSDFVKQLSNQLRTSHIIFSIDIPPDHTSGDNATSGFDHNVLGEFCDYVILMGYDQHWATDPTPGPVTSMPWLRDSINDLLKTGIQAQKIVLGLPSYGRIWEQNQQGIIINDPAYSYGYIETMLKKENIAPKWDSTLGEIYASYTKDSENVQIWIADTKSLQEYIKMGNQLGLAGNAFWSLNMLDPNHWNSLYNNI